MVFHQREKQADDSKTTLRQRLRFSANLNDLVLIAARKADPDTLFFQRRLRIEGDTELGLEIKNLIDGIDLNALPLLLNKLMGQCAEMIHQVELEQQEQP
ncbi:MAG: SCP2 sterol-binding domain-containing protein [Porticoccaceae bacterium]